MFSPTQRPLRDNTQRSQETDIRVSGGIRTLNPSKGEAADLRLRPRDLWDQQINHKYSMCTVSIHAVRSCAAHLNEYVCRFVLKHCESSFLFIYIYIYIYTYV